MKEDNKKEVKKHVLAGAGTAAGATIGAVIEDIVKPSPAETEADDQPIMAEVVATADDVQAEPAVEYAAAPVELDEVVVTAQALSHPHATGAPASPAHASAPFAGDDDEPLMAEVVAPSAIADDFDDIVVVSQGSDFNAGAFEVSANITAPAPGAPHVRTEASAHPAANSSGMPDYLAENDFDVKSDGSGISGIEGIDMPDYINNANIDSFTDPM